MHWGISDTPFGACAIAWNSDGICQVSFDPEHIVTGIRTDADAQEYAHRIFVQAEQVRCVFSGTPFQKRVWQALSTVPRGTCVTYTDVACMVADKRSVRAVAHAIAQNKIAVLVPCHRVIAASGALGGYRWSLVRKKQLQEWESKLILDSR